MDSFSMLHIFGLPPYITFQLLRSEGVKKIKLYWVYKKDGFGVVLNHRTHLRWKSGIRWKPWISLCSFESVNNSIERCLFLIVSQISWVMSSYTLRFAYLRLVKDESKQCMLPIFKETYIASLPSSLANVYGADTVDMFTTPSIVSLTTIYMCSGKHFANIMFTSATGLLLWLEQ